MIAGTDWNFRRTDAVNRLLAEKIFDDAVFQTVKRNYHDSSSVFQRRHGLRQNFCQTFQFFINDDAQGLESFGSRMNFIAPQTARNRFFDNFRQITGRGDAILFTPLHNSFGNAARVFFFAKIEN